jgi:hypothetical protein
MKGLDLEALSSHPDTHLFWGFVEEVFYLPSLSTTIDIPKTCIWKAFTDAAHGTATAAIWYNTE